MLSLFTFGSGRLSSKPYPDLDAFWAQEPQEPLSRQPEIRQQTCGSDPTYRKPVDLFGFLWVPLVFFVLFNVVSFVYVWVSWFFFGVLCYS